MTDPTPEQQARNMLERMGVPNAQSYTSGDLVELANLIAASQHRAAPEHWDKADWYDSCFIELRARVEALEKAQRPFAVIDTSQWAEGERQRASGFLSEPGKWRRLMYEEADPVPASADSLVERIKRRLIQGVGNTWEEASRAAIREVAAWLRENDAKLNMGGDAAATADLLDSEAKE